MKRGYVVTAYLSSDMPLVKERLVSVFTTTFVFRGDIEPPREVIEALVTAHTRNASLLAANAEPTVIPDETSLWN